MCLTVVTTSLIGLFPCSSAWSQPGLSVRVGRDAAENDATAVLRWTGDYGLYSTSSLKPPVRWQRVAGDPLVAADGRRLLNRPVLHSEEYFQLRPNPRPGRLATGLYVDALEPREIDLEDEAPLLRIYGQGFQDNAIVRLLHPGVKPLQMDLRPQQVQSGLIEVRIEPEWLSELSAIFTTRRATASTVEHGPKCFYVKVINGDGGSTDACLVLINDFEIRVNQIAVFQPLMPGRSAVGSLINTLQVSVERRTVQEDVFVEVVAYEAPPLLRPIAQPQNVRLARKEGIRGHALLPAGDTQLQIPLEIRDSIKPGYYLLQASVLGVRDNGDMVVLNSGSTEACVVDSASGKFPPSPAYGLQFDGFQTGQTSFDLMWKYPVNADGYVLERHTANHGWTTIATFGTGYVNGWIRYSDTGLQPDTEYCYRLRAWNTYGETLSDPAELCGTTAGLLTTGCYPSDCPPSPWIQFQPTTRDQTSIGLKWHFPLDADAYVLERKESWENNWTQVAGFPGGYVAGWIEYLDTGLSSCTEYLYRIRAWNENGETLGKVISWATNPWEPDDDWKLWTRTSGSMTPPDLEVTLTEAPTWNGTTLSKHVTFHYKWKDNADCEAYYNLHVQSPTDPGINYNTTAGGSSQLNGGWVEGDFVQGFSVHPENQLGTWRFVMRASNWDVPTSNYEQYVADSPIVEIVVPDPRPQPTPPDDPPPQNKPDLGFTTSIWMQWNAQPMTWVQPGQPFEVYWGVGNYGSADTGGFRDVLLLDGGSPWPLDITSKGPGWSDLEYRIYPQGLPEGQHLFERLFGRG